MRFGSQYSQRVFVTDRPLDSSLKTLPLPLAVTNRGLSPTSQFQLVEGLETKPDSTSVRVLKNSENDGILQIIFGREKYGALACWNYEKPHRFCSSSAILLSPGKWAHLAAGRRVYRREGTFQKNCPKLKIMAVAPFRVANRFEGHPKC